MLGRIDEDWLLRNVDPERMESVEEVREDAMNCPLALIQLKQGRVEPYALRRRRRCHAVFPVRNLTDGCRGGDVACLQFIDETFALDVDQLGTPASKRF